MLTLGPLGFTSPILLLGLMALPLLWLLLRAVPPAPIRRLFPAVSLLLGLKDDDNQTDRTPWWLLALRMVAIAALVIGFAGPVLNPSARDQGTGPLLILLDGTWGDASDWPARMGRIEPLLGEASAEGRETAIVSLTDLPAAGGAPFRAADTWIRSLAGFAPNPWQPDESESLQWLESTQGEFDTFWFSDGIAWDSREGILEALQDRGSVTVFETPAPVLALRPPRFVDGQIEIEVLRTRTGIPATATVAAHGLDPAGISRRLASVSLEFGPEASSATASLSVPAEMRNRISRFEIEGQRTAAAVTLTDDSLQRREIAVISPANDREGLELLSPTHFLEQALTPNADLIGGPISDAVLANPDVIILADIVNLTGSEPAALEEWVRKGGLLLRFAGPRLAASDYSRDEEDVLMPVRLRAGGRTVGGAMSWGEPKHLRTFAADSPFFGLPLPEDVTITSQVVAQPDPTLSERTIATLADGTPLVTRKRLDNGQVVLFHVTANAEWSTLPLSGLFVQMLERLSVSTRLGGLAEEDLVGTTWIPDQIMDGFGVISDAGTLPGVDGERLATEQPGPGLPPGLYAGDDHRVALNVITEDTMISPFSWPANIPIEGFAVVEETPVKGVLLSLGVLALMADILATLWLSGRMSGGALRVAIASVALLLSAPETGNAQESPNFDKLLSAASEVTLAHVVTGDLEVDRVAFAGLRGLSRVLLQRTSIEPGEPHGVDLEADELSVYPFLYWPISANQPLPSDEAYANLNQYLRGGGLILFDTRDSNTAGFSAASPNGRKLQEIARNLDIPALEPFPADHVLTRTFYLLQDFPGRFVNRNVWVEASPPDAEQVEGMPFRDLNDNVTPVVIGGNDWAGAWAIDRNAVPLYPVGRGFAGERQREVAYRFGVNLIMHVLTGNYKSDQVHVPALLDRLGQ